MVPAYDARGIIRLSKEKFSRIPVLKELHWQLLRRPGEPRPQYATRELAPQIKQSDLSELAHQAMLNGAIRKARFYARLRNSFREQNRRSRRND